jgi:hypothetical protein
MAVTPPATGPDEIDTALSYVKPTTRTDTWVFGGHIKMRAPVWYSDVSYSGQFGATYEFGPFLVPTHITSPFGPALGNNEFKYPYAQVYTSFVIGQYELRFDLTAQPCTYAQQYYRKGNTTDGGSTSPYSYFLHSSDSETFPNSDPATTHSGAVGDTATPSSPAEVPIYLGQAPVASFSIAPGSSPAQSSAVGLQYRFIDRLTSIVISEGVVNNNASEIASFTGDAYGPFTDTLGAPNHLGEYLVDRYTGEHGSNSALHVSGDSRLSIVSVDDDWTIEIDMQEVGISAGRNVWAYEWRPVEWRVTCGSATFTFTDPSPIAMDSVCGVTVVTTQTRQDGRSPDGLTTSSISKFSDWGYTADWLAEVSSWTLAGTRSGNGFTNLGGTTLPISSVNDNGAFGFFTGTLDASRISLQVAGSADTPISTTISGHTYSWHVPNSNVTLGIGGLSHGYQAGINLAPLCSNVLSDFDERWFDGTAFLRDPADVFAVRINSYVASWNAAIAGSGTAFTIPGSAPEAILSNGGFSLGSSPSVSYAPLIFNPHGIAYLGTTFPRQALNWPKWFIAESTDPFDTVSGLGRDIATLTFSVTQKHLPSITLSVSSDAMGGSNTATFAADMGNWSANRYLEVTTSGVSLAPGHKATLTLRTHNNHDIVYTLNPDPGTGIAVIDLTAPDGFATFVFGSGPGLWNPTPRMNATAGTVTTYSRVVNDVSQPNLDARIASIKLTVPGPLETFDITAIDFATPHTGFDGWVDPLGDGSGWSYQHTAAHDPPPTGEDFHWQHLGSLSVLVDGKRALKYPYYAKWPLTSKPPGTQQLYWDTPLMMADLLNDLPVLNTGLTATFNVTFTTPSSTAITANNCPVGLVWMDDSPYGAVSYIPWPGNITTYTLRRQLQVLTIPRYCCNYTLQGSCRHGGGVSGVAYNRSTNKARVSDTIKITHKLIMGGTRDSTNFPTGTDTVSTDTEGFFRWIFYDAQESPSIKGMGNAIPIPNPAFPWTISELTYNHFPVLISPSSSSYAAIDARLQPNFATSDEGGFAVLTTQNIGLVWNSANSAIPASDASLLINMPTNTYRVVFSDGVGVIYQTASTQSGQSDWSAPSSVGLTGLFPYAAVNPSDQQQVGMIYREVADPSPLHWAWSGNGGATFSAIGQILSSVSLEVTSRAVFVWVGQSPIVLVPNGTNITVYWSPSGVTGSWLAAGVIARPLELVSALWWHGHLIVSGMNGSALEAWVSRDIGQTFTRLPDPPVPDSLTNLAPWSMAKDRPHRDGHNPVQ